MIFCFLSFNELKAVDIDACYSQDSNTYCQGQWYTFTTIIDINGCPITITYKYRQCNWNAQVKIISWNCPGDENGTPCGNMIESIFPLYPNTTIIDSYVLNNIYIQLYNRVSDHLWEILSPNQSSKEWSLCGLNRDRTVISYFRGSCVKWNYTIEVNPVTGLPGNMTFTEETCSPEFCCKTVSNYCYVKTVDSNGNPIYTRTLSSRVVYPSPTITCPQEYPVGSILNCYQSCQQN